MFLRCPPAQYLDLGRTYVHWKQGHPQAGADAPDLDAAASDASSDEEVNAASQSGGCLPPFAQPRPLVQTISRLASTSACKGHG